MEGELLAKFIIQLVNGVAHLHQHGFIHRGIEMDSVYITAEENVLIGGLTDVIEAAETDNTEVGVSGQCPEYCEVVEGKRKTYDSKFDVWRLGWLISEIC